MPACQFERQATPATSNIEHTGTRLQAQFRRDMTLLLGLGDLKALIAVLKICARVLQVRVKKQAIEVFGQVIMMGDIGASPGDWIASLALPERSGELTRREWRFGEIIGDGNADHQEVAQRPTLQDKRPVHIGFTYTQHGVGQHPGRGAGISEPNACRWSVVGAEDVALTPGIDNHERPLLNSAPKRLGKKLEGGAFG